MRKWMISCSFIILIILSAFLQDPDKPIHIPPTKQRIGDAEKGFQYLVTGDYVRSGIPFIFFSKRKSIPETNYLKREGINMNIPFQYTAVKSGNGELVVAPNCLQCHAQLFDGQLIVGLGNSTIDFTAGKKIDTRNLELLEKMLKAGAPKQYEASATFIMVSKAVAPHLNTLVRGVNTADRLAAILAAHRDPETFKWSETEQLSIQDEVIPTDTPPWWLLKKKNGMFYNGFGRGDFGRFLMASNLFTVNDTAESREVDEHMPDVLAYIYSLQPPKYLKPIDKKIALKGKGIYQTNCSACHGNYGSKSFFPNLLIPESKIKTDSLLFKSNYSNPQFVNWFNKSWFTKGDHPAKLEIFNGYIAPPLDGIWITAPYLHNGSIPTLEALLNSKLRPKYWSRDFDHPQYDYVHVGWEFKSYDKPGNSSVYNTDVPGYGNYGHYYGDKLTEEERKSLIEYLKSL